MDEFELIRRFFDRNPVDDSVRIGVGDDGAVLSLQPGHDLVTVVDTIIEEVHFPAGMLPADVGFRAVAVNLSDLAAMAARPRWLTLALTIAVADESWLTQLASGFFAAADRYGVSLVGGDTTRGENIVITVQAMGEVPDGGELSRSGARIGDGIFVTGSIGDAAAGLSLMHDAAAESPDHDYLRGRFARPTARVDVGIALAGLATAAIDLSDGLFADTAKLLQQSGVGGVLDVDALPLSDALTTLYGADDAVQLAMAGGDDYELCFTAPGGCEDAITALSEQLEVAVSRIGSVTDGGGLSCIRKGADYAYAHPGFRHF